MKPKYFDRWRIQNGPWIWAEFANEIEARSYFRRQRKDYPKHTELRLIHLVRRK